MLIKIVTLPFDSAYGGFNDAALRDFLKDLEVISVRDHFFIRNDIPYLTLVIKYFPIRQELDGRFNPKGQRNEAWRESLSEQDMSVFNLLREWRAKRAKKEGMPPYILFTNAQFAQMVKSRPQSLAELMKIDGVGQAKIDKYGEEILRITKLNFGLEEKNQSKTFDTGPVGEN
jgi:superfamily II DNA helicase RecQ